MIKTSYEDLGELLAAVNPLAFKDKKGKIMSFPSYREAYKELLSRLYAAGPRYVDLVLFCVDTYGMSKLDAERFVGTWWSLGLKDSFALFEWQSAEDNTLLMEQCAKIAQGLHGLVEAKFQRDMFMAAWYDFMNELNVKLKKKRK